MFTNPTKNHFQSELIVTPNKMDFEKFELPLKIIRIFGFWTTKDTSTAYKIYAFFMHVIFVDMFVLFMAMYLTEMKTFLDFAQLISFLPIYTSCGVKITSIMIQADEVVELFEMVRECVTSIKGLDISEKISANLRVVDLLYKTMMTNAFFIIFALVISTFTLHNPSLKMWFPFALDTPWGFWTAAIYQTLNIFSMGRKFDGFNYPVIKLILLDF
jgi:hypothetical protein